MTSPQLVLCQRCETLFARPRRGAMPKYCSDCRVIVNREKTRDRDADTRAELQAKLDEVNRILEPMREYLTPAMIATAEQYLAGLAPDSVIDLVEDRMPAGTATPSGPDEGATSEFEDLRGELETMRLESVMHDWHAENPGWWDV